jgi:hypothetical protein
MPGSGTRTFVEPDQYEARLRPAQVELVVTSTGEFKARLTWVELRHLQLFRGEGNLPRIAFVSLPPRLVFVGFPADSSPAAVWRGTELQGGSIMLHSLGERLHEVTTGPSIWGLIALEPALLDEYIQVFSEKPLLRAQPGRVLCPALRNAARLRRLHAQARRLAQTKAKLLTYPEVARAIEQDLILALVNCLSAARVREGEPPTTGMLRSWSGSRRFWRSTRACCCLFGSYASGSA